MASAAHVHAASRQQQAAMLVGPVTQDGFPVRSLTRRTNATGGGEWIIAYQADQKRRLKAVLSSSIARETHSPIAVLRPPTNTREVSGVARRSLCTDFLLRHCCVEHPSDLCVCNISGEELREYKSEELSQFDNVVHVNASDNCLPLEAFCGFLGLQRLELSVSHVVDVSIHPGEFGHLQSLDLSYNSLSGCALLALGTLPSLTELHLTGNSLVALPVDMTRPFPKEGRGRRTSFGIRFCSLERLWLDDNKLTDQTAFATLAGLRKLKYLNLDNNELYTVPQLKLIGTSPLKATGSHSPTAHQRSTPTIPEEEEPTDSDTDENRRDGLAGETIPVQSPAPVTPDNQSHGRQPMSPPQTHGLATPTVLMDPPSSGLLADSMEPFPQLETLSLVNNLILSSEGLLACETWPVLKELIIYGNPLTRVSRGMPQLIKTRLVDQRGLTVIRHQPRPQKQHTIGRAAKEFKKVSTAPPPTIPRHPLPLLPSLKAQPPLMLEYPSPPPSSHESSSSLGEQSESCEEVDQLQGIFLTQPAAGDADSSPRSADRPLPSPPASRHSSDPGVGGATEAVWSSQEAFQAKRQALNEKHRDLPVHFRGYEFLFDTYDDPSLPVPTDTHGCVRALQYALRHPVVFGDTKSPVCRPARQPGSFLKRKPSASSLRPQPQVPSSVSSLQNVLEDIRSRCIALESNLDKALHPKTPPTRSTQALQRDSRQLLLELQAKYDRIRTSSLEAIRELSVEGSRLSSQATHTRQRRLSSSDIGST